MFDTPALASGLLPPFVYQLAKAALPFKDMTREKRASMTLGLQDEAAIYMATLALADKISIGRFHIGQELELDQIRGGGRFSRNWLYRFTSVSCRHIRQRGVELCRLSLTLCRTFP